MKSFAMCLCHLSSSVLCLITHRGTCSPSYPADGRDTVLCLPEPQAVREAEPSPRKPHLQEEADHIQEKKKKKFHNLSKEHGVGSPELRAQPASSASSKPGFVSPLQAAGVSSVAILTWLSKEPQRVG